MLRNSLILNGFLCGLLLAALPACDDIVGGDGEPLVVGTDSGNVVRLSGGDDSATVEWQGEIPAGADRVALASDGQDVFAGAGREVHAFALDGGGAQLWDPPASLDDDVVALAGPDGSAVYAMTLTSIVALQVSDGAELWSVDLLLDLPGSADDALVYGDGALFLGGESIRKLDPASGAVTADFDTGTGDSNVSDVRVSGGTLFAGLVDGVLALSTGSLSEQWKVEAGEVDNLELGESTILFSVLGAGLHAVTTGGADVGSSGTEDVYEAVAAGGGMLLGAQGDGTLDAFAADGFGAAWNLSGQTPVRGLAANDQTAFFASGGTVDAVNLSDGAEIWSWAPDGEPVALGAF
jgi:hypothetical protein